MNLEEIQLSDDFKRDLKFLGATVLIVLLVIAGNNIVTPDEVENVGFVEVETYCAGIDVGICLGVMKPTHTTYNYDDYEPIEEGTENYYRMVEAELMVQAYNICEDQDITEMGWITEAEYDGQTGDEWLEHENVNLLPCEETTYRHIEASE